MRKRRLIYNTVTSLLNQIVAVICGFILPRLILNCFGSEVNGLTNSIQQFLHIIVFLDLGVGAVVKSSLYKPLAERNNREISAIIKSARKFFNRLAEILLIYICVLMVLYPLIISRKYGYIYIVTLILAISISIFAQYYFGIVNQLLLVADQRGYIQYGIQMATTVLNTIACAILIKLGASIQVVMLTTSLIFLLRPIYTTLYINTNYLIDKNIVYEKEPIKQKWNGVAQHIAAVVLDGTDTIVLTIFATLSDVSVYSVYYLVIKGIRNLYISLTNGIQSLLGNLLAREETDKLNTTFGLVEWGMHSVTMLLFGCTLYLIVPFVQVYTCGVTDVDYYQPVFAILLTIANETYCIKIPQNMLILAAGHYKQTQRCFVVSAIINIVISVFAVSKWGLIGVTIGTIFAMFYQAVWMIGYCRNNIISWPLCITLKQIAVDITINIVVMLCCNYWKFELVKDTYISWGILAAKIFSVWVIVMMIVNVIVYRNNITKMIMLMKGRG
ncbi:hypothetical protein AALD22_05860 [Lachnospiraceae bacterium 56-18]